MTDSTHTTTAAELKPSMPKAQRLRKATHVHSAPPSEKLIAELRTLLNKLHPDDPNSNRRWITVVRAIFNSTNGHPDGFALADAWSRSGNAYTGPAGVRKYWKGLKLNHPNPATIRTLRWMAMPQIDCDSVADKTPVPESNPDAAGGNVF